MATRDEPCRAKVSGRTERRMVARTLADKVVPIVDLDDHTLRVQDLPKLVVQLGQRHRVSRDHPERALVQDLSLVAVWQRQPFELRLLCVGGLCERHGGAAKRLGGVALEPRCLGFVRFTAACWVGVKQRTLARPKAARVLCGGW